jgi:hypothetical protein
MSSWSYGNSMNTISVSIAWCGSPCVVSIARDANAALRRVTSKYSRWAAKDDDTNCGSHCPWVNNCVANNNHRHFVLYVLSLELGIVVFIKLVLACKSP